MINWKLRLQNKASLIAIVTTVISFVYFILDAFGIVPKFDKDLIVKAALALIDILALLGIVVDPTTKGIADSDRAMNYDKPASSIETSVEFDGEDAEEVDDDVDDEDEEDDEEEEDDIDDYDDADDDEV